MLVGSSGKDTKYTGLALKRGFDNDRGEGGYRSCTVIGGPMKWELQWSQDGHFVVEFPQSIM